MQQQAKVLQQQSFQTNTIENAGTAGKIMQIRRQNADLDIPVFTMLRYGKGCRMGRAAMECACSVLAAVVIFRTVPNAIFRKGRQTSQGCSSMVQSISECGSHKNGRKLLEMVISWGVRRMVRRPARVKWYSFISFPRTPADLPACRGCWIKIGKCTVLRRGCCSSRSPYFRRPAHNWCRR